MANKDDTTSSDAKVKDIKDKKTSKTVKIEDLKKDVKKKNTKIEEIKTQNIETKVVEDKSTSPIIEVGQKTEVKSLREMTKIFFDDLRTRFKNLFAPEKDIKYLPEYYDLPYRYNKDTVKILAQTPHKLFVYWDFDDSMKKEITEKYGEYFWDKTHPVLIVRNLTKNYSFEIKIDDFANSWYIDIPDNTSIYKVEIGRKLKENFEYSPRIEFEIRKNKYIEKNLGLDKDNLTRELLEQRFMDENKNFNFYRPSIYFEENQFIHFGSSNNITSPSGHVLFDTLSDKLRFRNVQTGTEYDVVLKKKSLVHGLYDVYDDNLYSEGESRPSRLTTSGLAFERNY